MSGELQLVLILNIIGLGASFLVRKFFKKNPIVEFMPYIFLYLSSIFCLHSMMGAKKAPVADKVEIVHENTDEKMKLFNAISKDGALIKKISTSNDCVSQEIIIDEQKLSFSSSLLKFAKADSFEGGKFFVALIDSEGKPVSWSNYDSLSDKIVSSKYSMSLNSNLKNYANQTTVGITNNTNLPEKLTLVVYVKVPEGLSLNYDKTAAEKNKTAVFSDKNWINCVSGEFDSLKVLEQSASKNKILEIRKEITLKELSRAEFKINLLTGPNQITKVSEYEKDFGTGIEKLAYPEGFIGRTLSMVFYKPFVSLFEIISKFTGPLLAMLIIILVFKLATAPINYQGHGFGKEFQKIISVGVATKNQDGIRNALMNNKNLNIRMKVISVVLKLAFFMIFWRVFNTSPLFYGAKFLWINNLALPDQLVLNNLFGLIKFTIPLLPKVGLLAILTIILFYFEMENKNKTMRTGQEEQSKMTVFILLVFFLFGIGNMPAVFCIYLLINNILDNAQNSVFDLFKKSGKRIAK